jgi:hypothetical protein
MGIFKLTRSIVTGTLTLRHLIRYLVSPATIHIRIDPGVKLVAHIARMWSRVRASYTTRTTSTSALDTHVARGVGTVVHI